MIRHILFVFLNLNLNLGVCNLFLYFNYYCIWIFASRAKCSRPYL